MKTTDFKLWDVFREPMSSKLSLVVKIDDKYVHVISDKPSVFSLKRHNQEVCYYITDVKPEVILETFKHKMSGKYEQKVYNTAISDYYDYKRTVQTITNRRLLITI